MTMTDTLTRSIGGMPLLGRFIGRIAPRAVDRNPVGAALAAASAWYFEVDADRIIRDVFPAPAAVRAALIGCDIRSFIDPLDPLSEHPRMARAFRGRAPFRDVLMPFNRGQGVRRLRVSGDPIYDRRGTFLGYRGLAIDTAGGPAPTDAAGLLAPDLRDGLVNALGVVIGFARFLEDDLPAHGAQAGYAARIRIAADAARALVLGAMAGPTTVATALPEPGPHAVPHGRVLVVHESPEVGDLLSTAFDRAGFECGVCRDGLEAVEILAEDPTLWDALVTTAETATLDGAAIMRRAKALRPDLLCVVVDQPGDAAAVQSEADLCWPRPGDVVALAQVVKAELDLRAVPGTVPQAFSRPALPHPG